MLADAIAVAFAFLYLTTLLNIAAFRFVHPRIGRNALPIKYF